MSMNVYAGCFRNVAEQPSSNYHLEKLLKVLSVENIGVEPMTS